MPVRNFVYKGHEYQAAYYNLYRAGVVVGLQLTGIELHPYKVPTEEVDEAELQEFAKQYLLGIESGKTQEENASLTGVYIPSHSCAWSIAHNEHRDLYEDPARYIEEHSYVISWQSEEMKQEAIRTGEIWTMYWTPRNPVASYGIAAPTLEDLNRFAREITLRDKATTTKEETQNDQII